MKSYAAYYEHEIRKSSSSGGIFSVIASYYDVVYGVAMTEDCHGAEFQRMTGDISPLRGSKYFQAKVGDTFRQVKLDLEAGKTVLFTGTVCQVNGLRMFLQKDYANLLAMDIICHGVPSPKLWDVYANYREKQYGKKLKSVNFRCKGQGWPNSGIKENQLYISKNQDSFMQMFLRNYCLRPSCYQCHAKKIKLADLTIADFWGIESVVPEMNDGLGTSLVITRTEKGQAIFEAAKSQLYWKEVSYEEGIRYNPAEYCSPIRPEQRNIFFYDLAHLPFSEMEKRYASETIIPRSLQIKRKLRKIIDKIALHYNFIKSKFSLGHLDGKNMRGRVIQNANYGLLFTFLDSPNERKIK